MCPEFRRSGQGCGLYRPLIRMVNAVNLPGEAVRANVTTEDSLVGCEIGRVPNVLSVMTRTIGRFITEGVAVTRLIGHVTVEISFGTPAIDRLTVDGIVRDLVLEAPMRS